MIGTFNCVYETPCGWCSKWDKKCDKKIPEIGQRAKNDAISKLTRDAIDAMYNNSNCDHKWEWLGSTSLGDTTYRCTKCGCKKTYPPNVQAE